MHLTSVASAALLAHTALGTSIFSQQLCATQYGLQSVHSVPTTTYALTIPLTVYIKTTTTPVATITPPPVTNTIQTTKTFTATVTAPTSTGTITTTSTETDTSVSTSTFTQTSTIISTTQTTVVMTTTVPTPAGFTPISKEQGYSPKIKGRSPFGLAARGQQVSVTYTKVGNQVLCKPQLYPTSVVCGQLVEQVTTKTTTKTASTTSTTTIPPVTKTTTSTASTTMTTTSIPPNVTFTITASTTITVSTDTSTTTTVVTTSTSTETISTPGPTIYAACSPDNIVNTANGGYDIDEINDAGSYSIVTAGSAYDCCVACQQSIDCHGSFFLPGLCGIATMTGSTCNPGGYVGGLTFQTGSEVTGTGFEVSDGPCGGVMDGG